MNLRAIIITAVLISALAGVALGVQHKGEQIESLTYSNIVSFFKSTGLRVTEVQKRCTVFFEGQWTNPNIYNYCLIIVENSDQDVQVTFYLTDAHEMNWVSEFLDAPYFARNETERLFALMNAGSNNAAAKVGRYRVDFHRWQPRHAEILVFSFTKR
jgi:hypothetical protein